MPGCGTGGTAPQGGAERAKSAGPEPVRTGPPAAAARAGAATPLRIPYGNKEAAFAMGARYGAAGWYAPPGVDLDPFRRRGWL